MSHETHRNRATLAICQLTDLGLQNIVATNSGAINI